ncbi:MEG-8 family [Schistosoma mansoni]|uniref:MEG-8 family n=1 Tax=Schistosoma mansoni TaxID=6183 RepID=G4VCW5_SCHMA|nr:MEG-8 family [Schistosoma mansoni]|eukprot:XP_018650362.1 MEG-8 family [Schistosoma mansoni]
MFTIILIYVLYFIANAKFEHTTSGIRNPSKLSDSNASKTLSLKNLTDHYIHTPQKSNNGTSCNGKDTCKLPNPSQKGFTNTTSLPHTQSHNSTVAPSVPKPTRQEIPRSGTIVNGTKPTPGKPVVNGTKPTPGKPESFLKRVGDGFFDLFSEQEFHPINHKSYLFNFWYLFRTSFLNLKNMKNLLLGS